MIKQLKNTPVLITGDNGFIGSHLTKRLVVLGAKVSAFVEPGTSLWRIQDIKNKIKVYPVDITKFKNVDVLIKKIKPIKVYHLAAHVNVNRSLDLLSRMVDINIKGTTNVLNALENTCKVDCFINTGTGEEYGDGDVPFLESQRENPVSPYSASKVCTTYLCQMLHKIYNMPIITLRPFLTYGPYQTNDMLIPLLIRKCLLGKEFEMTKGEQTRDFNYVSDIVEGYIKASITQRAIGEIINLGSGREYKIKDVVNLIFDLTKSKVKPKIGKLAYRQGETMNFYCSNRKAQKILKWKPKISLNKGLCRTIGWYKGYINKE
ncbi:MAG: GDP-mannose 4,6-dehydratase [Candidatus Omnitrophica bacterium]|nr:GDP-mannose 4,6-dehydratase [Candidatus Omnitrophota bacterium]